MLKKQLSARHLIWLIVAVIVLLFAVYWLKFKPVPVIAHTVANGDLYGEVMGTGTLEARVKTTISPRIQERLAEVFFDQGDTVKTGQLLARLDDAELKQQVAVAQATLAAASTTVTRVRTDEARARAVLQQARLQHKRLAELVSGKAASQEELDKATETLHIAEADLNRSRSVIVEARSQIINAENNLQLRREQLAFTELRSPYEGLIVRRDRDPGGIVVPGSSILQLINTKEIWISAWVDETSIAALAVGQPVRVVFRSEATRNYSGTVARLGREADRETREFLVDVRVQQLPVNWAVGQRAEVYIESGHKSAVIAIPQKFLLWRGGEPGVFVNYNGRALWRSIALGLYGQQDIEVTKGLSASDQIVMLSETLKQPLEDGQAISVQ
ncbi:efflux RND transporter periplasmic adaptor subunit [Methylobacter sp. G7]|uniref:efflux RND transporter periplasmic adaptor subunit n=1 Tax=Methylobacter sp. G7 TaxID=3230117 RepID=UPI003D808065